MQLRQRLKFVATAAIVAVAMSLGGCGSDGVELNGAVFDWMGVSPAAQASRRNEPKLSDRAPLVIPPDVSRLPDPGSGQTTADTAWPLDPEQRKAGDAKERERLHLAYCRGEIQWKEKALEPQSQGVNRSPYGPCPSVFSGTSNINFNKQ